MSQISPELQSVLDNYAQSLGGKTSPDYQNTLDVISNSPELSAKMNDAVRNQTLKSIQLDTSLGSQGAGAQYDPSTQTMTLGNTRNAEVLVFQMGHEIQHAFNASKTDQITNQTVNDIYNKASSLETTHDYTAIIKNGLTQNRKDEASAHLEGWNAYVSYMNTKKPTIDLQTLAKNAPYQNNFFDQNPDKTYSLKSGLVLSKDMKIDQNNAQNIDSMGKYYFDNGGAFGKAHNLDYQNYYGQWYLEQMANAENSYRPNFKKNHLGASAEIVINMNELRLNEAKIETNNLSIPGQHLKYKDSSSGNIHSSSLDGTSPQGVTYNPITEPQKKAETNLNTPNPNASLEQLFEHLYAASRSNNSETLAQAVQHVTQSDIGQSMRAETVSNVQAQQQAAELAQQQALTQQAEQAPVVQRGPVMRM
ncbi:MAG: hypothetical protein ACRCV6_02155 [Formosimonas sp.]